jgi:ATP-binding cassette, subfamily B, bacterial
MTTLHTLLPYLKPYRWRIVLVLFSILIVTAAGLAAPWLVRELVRSVRLAEGDLAAATRGVGFIALALLIAYSLRSLGQYLNFHISHVVAWNVCHDLREAVYSQLQRFSPAYYSERQTGEVASRVLKDTDNLEPVLADALYDFVVSALLAIGIVVILLTLEPSLTLLAFLPLPIVLMAVLWLRRPVNAAFEAEATRFGEVSALVQDNLAGIREIQVFGRERQERERVTQLSRRLAFEQIRARKLYATMYPLIEGATGISTVLVVWFGGRRALEGSLLVEDLVAFVLYLAFFYQLLWSLANVGEALERGRASLSRLHEVLTLSPGVADPADGHDLGCARGEMAFAGVSFAYRESFVLQDIDLHVKPGQTLALVGPTGAGKSTLANLIARFYDPQQGCVRLDGHDLREVRLESLRGNLSMVLQDVFLFYGSVRDNIRFGKPGASDEAVEVAARVANAHEFIEALPQGYDTVVGERGVKLSGGQKQRLSIARAILKDAPVLILDEATNSVDSATEAQIQGALERLMRGRTSVVIAHRLSTVRDADLIVVLDEGRVVEQGTHEALIAHSGLYHKLHKEQFERAA